MNIRKIAELCSKGKYVEILEENLKDAKRLKYTGSLQKRQNNADLLFYFLVACEGLGLYCDYLDILQKYNENDPLKYTNRNKSTVIKMVTFELEALIYCLYNNESEQLGIDYDIPNKIEEELAFLDELVKETGVQYTERQVELKNLYEDYFNGRLPIYTVSFLYPFEPIIENHIFDLSQCLPYISLDVERVPRETDNYTKFTVTAYGLIKPDSFWQGPKWETREKLPPVRKALDIVNMLLLYAVKASPGKMVLPCSIEQVSTVDNMYQYRWDKSGTILGGIITSTDFSSQWVGGNAQWHKFSDEELQITNDALVRSYGSKPFVRIYHNATNLLSAGFNAEAFLLFCSCGEGMIHHWCEEIATIKGIRNEYLSFANEKVSKCDSCGYYNGKESEKPRKDMVRSIYENLTFLQKRDCITKSERNRLKAYFSRLRSNDLRNIISHGADYAVSRKDAENAEKALLDMQQCFLEIEDRLKQESL